MPAAVRQKTAGAREFAQWIVLVVQEGAGCNWSYLLLLLLLLFVDRAAQEPENAHSHLLSMVLGNSETIPVTKGQLAIGTWQVSEQLML